MSRLVPLALSLMLLVGSQTSSQAVPISFTATRDTFLQQAAPDANFGAQGGIVGGLISGTHQIQRSVVGFNLSALNGTYSSISSVVLTLYGRSFSGTNKTIDIYEILAANSDWVEGNGTGTSVPGASTWNSKWDGAAAWTGGVGLGAPGGGYGSTPLASRTFLAANAGSHPNTPFTFTFTGDLTALMNRWMTQAGGANAGILLRLSNETIPGTDAEQVAFQALQNGNSALFATLAVNYVPIPEPCSLLLFGCGALALGWVRRSAVRRISKR